jgi:hypothetical protein
VIKDGLIVILILLSVFLFSVRKRSNTITTTKIDTVINTQTFFKYQKGDKIKVKIIDTFYQTKNDTAYIVKDYNQVKEFTDTIRQMENVYIIKDTISGNRIQGRSFKAQIQEKIITVTNNIEIKPKAALYLGIRSDISQDMLKANHNLTLTFKTRKKGLFSVGYGMSGYSLGYSIKL